MIANRIGTKLEAFERRAKYGLVVGELLQKTNLATGRGDCGLVVLAHLIFDEARDQFSRRLKGSQVEMQVVHEEEDGPAAIQRRRADRLAGVGLF